MKIRISMKNPDCVSDALDEAADKSVSNVTGIDAAERSELRQSRREELADAIKPWVEYEEYITAEIDTDKQTATVLRVN